MRVLYFHHKDGVHDRRFLKALGQLPVEVIAVRLDDEYELGSAWIPADNIQRMWIPGAKGDYHWYQKARIVRHLQRIIRENHIDVIHAGPLDLCAWLAAEAGIKPLVSMSWGFDLLVNAESNLVNRRRIKQALHHTAILLVDCQTVKNAAIRFGFPDRRIVSFPWGVDLQVYRPKKLLITGDRLGDRETIKLLSTRTMEKLYGCDVIIEAFIKAASQNEFMVLTMLGDGSQKNRLMRRITSAGLGERVFFTGSIPEEDMITYFQESDIYISASHSDGSSISLLQAMACGLPVIVSDISGNREWVGEGRNGWLFKDGDRDALAKRMIEACKSGEQRTVYGKAARMTTVERADWQKNKSRLIEAYQLALTHQQDGGER